MSMIQKNKIFDNTVYFCDATCGHNQYAYLLRESENNFLCLDTNVVDGIYNIGELVEDIESIYLTPTDKSLDEFEISRSFLFKKYFENRK